MALNRRRFLQGGTAAAAGLALGGGPFQGFVARAAGAPSRTVMPPALQQSLDLRDLLPRLDLPPGFEYRSFDVNSAGATLSDGTPVPGTHDGMTAFSAGDGRVQLLRNHERNGSLGAFTSNAPVYDSAAPGGVTSVIVDLQGNVQSSWAALAGTQMNCAGGHMPWGSWVTCEETVNGPDVFDDFTRGGNPPTTYIQNKRLQKQHGYMFEAPKSGTASAEPITMAGRFAKEAAVFSPNGGSIYLTEDNFGFGSGFYRYDPPVDPRQSRGIEDGGTLWMLGIAGDPQANLSGAHARGTEFPVTWIRIDDPDPTFPMAGDAPDEVPTTTNNQAIQYVGRQGWDGGGAVFSRLEGCIYDRGVVYFTATQGGGVAAPVDWTTSAEPSGFGNGAGQVWAYYPNRNVLEVVYQSSGPADLHLPDNITTSPRGTLVICEDNSPQNTLQALTKWGQLIPIADHRERPNVEFAGAVFSPNGQTLYVNLQTSLAMSVAIWGPWHQLGV
jgi:uncharacterized protein